MGIFRIVPFFSVASATAALSVLAGAAHAAVVISDDATENVTCSSGVCAPTSSNAVLNANDLGKQLARGDVKVTTTGSGVQAQDIEISNAFGWSTTSRLILNAHDSIGINGAVSVKGRGSLTFKTGQNGTLSFGQRGHVSFADVSSGLLINTFHYMLENSIKSLASAIANNPNGAYALANSYDASADGTYSAAPVATPLRGQFEGLGNTISNLTVSGGGGDLGFFTQNVEGVIRDITLENASVTSTTSGGDIGTLVGYNAGMLNGAHATGSVTGNTNAVAGGLVGANTNRANMSDDDADVVVTVGASSSAGGLAGENEGPISQCYAGGDVKGRGTNLQLGGLVGNNAGQIENAYARGSTRGGTDSGGLIGYNGIALGPGSAISSYSTGIATAKTYAGGVIGFDDAPGADGGTQNTYWDTSTSDITNPGQGAGSPANDPGLTGLTTAQLQSGLPAGFDPTVWAENPAINDGLPYLLADPPR
jgi:hypothetical protein